MKIRYVLLVALLSFGLGIVIAQAFATPDPTAKLMDAFTDLCRKKAPKGQTSYPVTFYGELRGCLNVAPGPTWAFPRTRFVRVTHPL